MTRIHRKTRKNIALSFNQHYKKYLPLFAFFILLLLGGIFANPKMIKAQIAGLYNKKTDEIASINALMSAVTSHDVEGVKFFVKAGDSLINQKNLGGATALHLACREKDFAIAQILVANKADVNIADNEGWTPLMRAALAGQSDIVNLLLDAGAKADLLNSVGESAIYQAASSGCNECLVAIFGKVNLIRIMDLNILKIQLRESYMMAQSRDNEQAQAILSNYLDQAVRMGAVINNADVVNAPRDGSIDISERTIAQKPTNLPLKQSSNIPVQKPAKVFNFNSSKTGKVTQYVADDNKMLTNEVKPSSVIVSPVKKQNDLVTKKFSIKKSEADSVENKIPQSVKAKPSQVGINEISLNDDAPVAAINSNSTNANSVAKRFKFSQGTKGKIVKVKPKSQVQTQAPVVIPADNSQVSPATVPVPSPAPVNNIPKAVAPAPAAPPVVILPDPSAPVTPKAPVAPQSQKDSAQSVKVGSNNKTKTSDLTLVAMKQNNDVIEGGNHRAPAAAFALSATSLK